MARFRWGRGNDVFEELSRVQNEMSRLWGELEPWFDRSYQRWSRNSVFPPMNIYDDGETLVVRAEIPGLVPASLDLETTSDTLTIRGERKPPELSSDVSYHRRERNFGQFRRALSLPSRVDTSKVVATMHDGILEVRLPHAEENKLRKITVKTS